MNIPRGLLRDLPSLRARVGGLIGMYPSDARIAFALMWEYLRDNPIFVTVVDGVPLTAAPLAQFENTCLLAASDAEGEGVPDTADLIRADLASVLAWHTSVYRFYRGVHEKQPSMPESECYLAVCEFMRLVNDVLPVLERLVDLVASVRG